MILNNLSGQSPPKSDRQTRVADARTRIIFKIVRGRFFIVQPPHVGPLLLNYIDNRGVRLRLRLSFLRLGFRLPFVRRRYFQVFFNFFDMQRFKNKKIGD